MRRLALSIAAVAGLESAGHAQAPAEPATLQAHRVSGAIQIDGRLDEDA